MKMINDCPECGKPLTFTDRIDNREICFRCREEMKISALETKLIDHAKCYTIEERVFHIEKVLSKIVGDSFFK